MTNNTDLKKGDRVAVIRLQDGATGTIKLVQGDYVRVVFDAPRPGNITAGWYRLESVELLR